VDSIISKVLIGWNAGVWTYLVLMFESTGTRIPTARPRTVALERRGWVRARRGMEAHCPEKNLV
jgi:hypothetical protein